ncbi:MAG TPA: DUF1549 and DUF1553 domain-containing protein [Bryobacteraceae bacterium]|nr:DUF1549 and DUF1553 domain-containing protein [Bryobacteraceae bacterium]
MLLKLVLAASLAAAGLAAEEQVTFLRDVAPILNKTGCTSGPCHGAAKGKNGFKLSLRGYDPQYDYEALLYDLSGRRFNRADPGKSLMLAKPSQEIAHGGGLRFEKDSDYYKTIYNWIAQGVPFGDPAKDSVVEMKVEPKEIFMSKPGETAAVKVVVRYQDGAIRDVTRETSVESNIPDVASVDVKAAVKGERVGEATLLVRYAGKFSTIPVTVLNPKPGFAWKPLPQHNYIDQQIDTKLERLKIQPSPLADDAAFLRRVSLDLTGLLPPPEAVRAFVADPAPSRVKRSKMIDRLIASPAYVDHWTVKWGDLLQTSRKYLGEKGAYEFQQWIRDSVASNKPYDKLVHELLTSRGSSYDDPAANFFRVTREAKPTMEKTTQVFLGVRMVCAQCHDHPFERWTQTQYYQMAAFFSAVGLRAGYEVGEEIVFDQRSEYEMKHPKDGHVVKPEFMLALSKPLPVPGDQRRRDALAEWLTSKDNPFFAKAIANRIWSYFFGRGIIDPVDDIRASNPATNPALLDALTKDVLDHNFDLQQLMRTITNSRAYQASFTNNEWNQNDRDNFSHAMPRRLSAEELMDAVSSAAGARPHFPEVPEDTMAEQLVDPHIGQEGFLDVFGRPPRESSCECERRSDFSLPQALNLVNGKTISDAVADPKGRVAKLVLSGKGDAAIVDELYLASLSRVPTAAESDLGVKYLAGGAKAGRAQDLLWALLNSKGFLYIY